MKQTENRTKALAITAIISIAIVFLFTSVIEPYIERYKQTSRQMNQLQLKLIIMQRELIVKSRVNNIYSQIESLISSRGTKQQEISLFTQQLDHLYSKIPVEIRAVKILPSVDGVFYNKLFVRVEMFGKAKDIIEFISLLESTDAPLRIEKFTLKAKNRVDYIHASFLASKVVVTKEEIKY